MKILKLDVKGLPLLNSDLCIDFIAQQRVDDNDKEQLYNIFSNISLCGYAITTLN